MKVVIGIVLISLVILGLIAYMILMLNAREMIFCGDLKNENGTNAQITRVYTTDLNANETLSEIIVKMNESDTESVPDIFGRGKTVFLKRRLGGGRYFSRSARYSSSVIGDGRLWIFCPSFSRTR